MTTFAIRTSSQKIKTYNFRSPMNTFAPSTLEGLHQGKKNDPIDFTVAKVLFKEKSIILNDFIKKN